MKAFPFSRVSLRVPIPAVTVAPPVTQPVALRQAKDPSIGRLVPSRADHELRFVSASPMHTHTKSVARYDALLVSAWRASYTLIHSQRSSPNGLSSQPFGCDRASVSWFWRCGVHAKRTPGSRQQASRQPPHRNAVTVAAVTVAGIIRALSAPLLCGVAHVQ